MARLNSDNPDTMPVTDSVYGHPRRQAGKESNPRGHGFQLEDQIPSDLLDELYLRIGRIKKGGKRG